MNAVLEGVDHDFGSIANHFSHAGATESAIERVRTRLRAGR